MARSARLLSTKRGLQGAMDAKIRIEPVTTDADLAAVRTLLKEYWDSFGFAPCFQNFGAELDGLPGAYAAPAGRLALVRVEGEPAGCVALRRMDDRRAEPKRLYVRPGYRGLGLGRSLLQWVMDEARAMGYTELAGDTMPQMREALALYRQMGFECSAAPESGEGGNLQTEAEPILIRIAL